MKKLERLTLKELGEFCYLMEPREAHRIIGGDFTYQQAEVMMNAGTWTGGYIDGVYCGGTCAAWPQNMGNVTVTTFSDWSNSHLQGPGTMMINEGIGDLPYVGPIFNLAGSYSSNDNWSLNTACLVRGMTGNSYIYERSGAGQHYYYDSCGNRIIY